MSRKTFGIFISVLAVVIMALAGMNIALDNRTTWDCEMPMANARVSWEQTFYPGVWNSD